MLNQPIGLASLFASHARTGTDVRFVCHKNWHTGGWDIFEKVPGRGEVYACASFQQPADAQTYCNTKNRELMCCCLEFAGDDKNCPVHGGG
jgi:hypothetical protein